MSRIHCRPFDVPYGQRPAVLEILIRHGFFSDGRPMRFRGSLDPGALYTYSGTSGSGSVLADDIRRHAPSAAFEVWDTGDEDEAGMIDSYAPSLGSCRASSFPDGRPVLEISEVTELIDRTALGRGTIPVSALKAAVDRASGAPWGRLASRAATARREEQGGQLLLCDTCMTAITGDPAACAPACQQEPGHQGLCLGPAVPACLWCGAEGRLHEASFDAASQHLPVGLLEDDGSLSLVFPAAREGPFDSGADAWAAWQSGQFTIPPGRARLLAAQDAAFYEALRVVSTDDGEIYEARASMPGRQAASLTVHAGGDSTVTSGGNLVSGIPREKAIEAVRVFRTETGYQERLARLQSWIGRHGGRTAGWKARLAGGSGERNDRECDYVLQRADGGSPEITAVISPADLLRIVPDAAVTDQTGHDPARRAQIVCEYLNRDGVTRGAAGPALTRKDRVQDLVTGAAGTVINSQVALDDAGKAAEWAEIAYDSPAGGPGSTETRRADTVRKLPPPVSGIPSVIDVYPKKAGPRITAASRGAQNRPGPSLK
jgi:hypothetical protein